MTANGQIYRVQTHSISIGRQNWPKGSLISGERLGALVRYFESLGMIEAVTFTKADPLEERKDWRVAA
jgi:hypothetical protein